MLVLYLMIRRPPRSALFHFFFNDTATTEIYTLSLHDALPISAARRGGGAPRSCPSRRAAACARAGWRRRRDSTPRRARSEEHTSELQSRQYLVCRLLLEKKKITQISRMKSSASKKNQYSTLYP